MKTLYKAVQRFQLAQEKHEDDRQVLNTLRDQSADYTEARAAFLASSADFESAYMNLRNIVADLLRRGRLRHEYEQINRDERYLALRALRDAGIEALLYEARPGQTFEQLLKEWINAAHLLTAAESLRDLLQHQSFEDFNDAIASTMAVHGAAGEEVLALYREELASTGEDESAARDATRTIHDELLADYDRVGCELMETAQRMGDQAALSSLGERPDHNLLLAARDLLSHVAKTQPLPQVQTSAKLIANRGASLL